MTGPAFPDKTKEGRAEFKRGYTLGYQDAEAGRQRREQPCEGPDVIARLNARLKTSAKCSTGFQLKENLHLEITDWDLVDW